MMRYKILLLTVLLLNQSAFAIDIYKCVDHEGITHFSAAPILDCENQLENIILDEPPTSHNSDEYSVMNQLERMQKRKAREQQQERARLEEQLLREQIRAARRQAAEEQEKKSDEPDWPVTYLPIYGPPRHSRRAGRKHSRPTDIDKPRAGLRQKRAKEERGLSIQLDTK